MQIAPALPVGAPQGLSPQDGPEPLDLGFQDAREDVQEEGLVLMGRPAPSTPRNFPQQGSFIEASQAVIARWITRTTRQQQQTTAQQNEWQRELQQLQEKEEQLQRNYQKQVETLAPRMREEFHSYYENKWELVRQRAKEEFFRLEDASERQQVHMQQELNQRLMTAESQLERHQTELVQGFSERIQQGKNELQGSRQAETRLRSELSQHLQRSERAASLEIAWTQAEEQKNALQAQVARDGQLAQELRSAEQRMAAETARVKGEVKELTRLTQSERQQTEEARRESRSERLEVRRLQEELQRQASDPRTPVGEPSEGRTQVLTNEAAEAKAFAEQVRTQTEEYVTWNDQITEGLRRDLAESQEEMASCDEDRSQLYDKVVQQAGEIHDLEFQLATAKALTGNQGAVEPPTGAASSQHPPGLPVQTTPTVTDMTRQWESPGQGQSEYGTDPASTAGGVSSGATVPVGDARHLDEDEMKKVPRRDRTALPKLQMNPGSSATEMIQVLQQWMSQMGLVLATWTDTATEWWQRIISEARADHVQFCRLGARERALLHGQSRETFALPTAVSPLEGQVRADLIRGDLLPKAVKNALHLQGIDTVLGILKIIFREYMPSESTCRLETLQALERPVKAGRTYKECLTALRRFNYDLRVLVRELRATPDYLRMYQSLRDLPTNVLKEDPLFASDLSAVLTDSGIELVQNQTNFTVYVEGLEKQFHAGSLKEDEKGQKGIQRCLLRSTSSRRTTRDSTHQNSRGQNPKRHKSRRGHLSQLPIRERNGKNKMALMGRRSQKMKEQRPLCRNFITSEGCQFGRRCRYYHPNKAGKCRVCGGESHQADKRTRPKEPNKEWEKSRERPKSKAKAGARAATVEAEARSVTQSSALAWARGESADCPDVSGETLQIEPAAVLEVADQLPTVKASQGKTEGRDPLLDTGASHLLVNLDHLTEEQASEAIRIHVKQATGSPKRALLLNGVIYAADVGRVLVSVGALRERLRLDFDWTCSDPMLVFEDAQGRWELFRGSVDGRLPVLTQGQFAVLFRAYQDSFLGVVWDRRRWVDELDGKDLPKAVAHVTVTLGATQVRNLENTPDQVLSAWHPCFNVMHQRAR